MRYTELVSDSRLSKAFFAKLLHKFAALFRRCPCGIVGGPALKPAAKHRSSRMNFPVCPLYRGFNNVTLDMQLQHIPRTSMKASGKLANNSRVRLD